MVTSFEQMETYMRLAKLQKQNYIDFALKALSECEREQVQKRLDRDFKAFAEKGKKDFCMWESIYFVRHAVIFTAVKLYGGMNDKYYRFMDQYNGANLTNLARDVMIGLEKQGFNCYLDKRYK